MTPNIIELSEKTVIGIKSSMHHNQFEKIVELWKRFIPKRVLIKNTVNTAFIALQEYSDFNNMETSFKIWACVEVTDLNIIPEGMANCIIPKGDYAVFLHKGMNASVTYQKIMSDWLPNSGYEIDNRPHFQVMGKKYKNGIIDSEEDFYVPIRLKM